MKSLANLSLTGDKMISKLDLRQPGFIQRLSYIHKKVLEKPLFSRDADDVAFANSKDNWDNCSR